MLSTAFANSVIHQVEKYFGVVYTALLNFTDVVTFKVGFLLFLAFTLASLAVWEWYKFQQQRRENLPRAADTLKREELARRIAQGIKLQLGNGGRIAVVGPWGAGKSWLAETIVKQLRDDVVLRSVKSSLSRSHRQLVQEIVKNIQLTSMPRILRPWGRFLFILNRLSEITIGNGAFSFKLVNEDLHPQYERLAAWTQLLSKPLLVVIDDIDRMKPEEIGPFFAAFEEISHLPNVTFLLLYDNKVVSNSLELCQPAWKPTDQFLVKMVDIEYYLGSLDADDSWPFFLQTLGFNPPSQAIEALSEIKEQLPTYPRLIERLGFRLRRLNNGFSKLPGTNLSIYEFLTFQRDIGESMGAAFYVAFARYHSLRLISRQLADSLTKEAADSQYILEESQKEARIDALIKANPIVDPKVEAICRRICSELLGSFIFRPAVIDNFESLMMTDDASSLIDLANYLDGNIGYDEWESSWVVDRGLELLLPQSDQALQFYHVLLAQAADADLFETHRELIQKARRLLKSIEAIFVQILKSPNSIKSFEQLLSALNRFANFKGNTDDISLRRVEEETLIRLLQGSPHAPILLTMVRPQEFPSFEREEAVNDRYKNIRRRVNSTDSIAQMAFNEFVAGNINRSLKEVDNICEFLVDPSSAIWQRGSPLWEEPLTENLSSNIKRLVWHVRERPTLKKSFFVSRAFAKRFWSFLVESPWQYRSQAFLGEVAGLLASIHPERANADFPKPLWITNPRYDFEYKNKSGT